MRARHGVVRGGKDAPDGFDEERLRVAGAEVEADGFEDEALEADDEFGGVVEDLGLLLACLLPYISAQARNVPCHPAQQAYPRS